MDLERFDLIRIELLDDIAHLRLARPAKRNAISDRLIAQLDDAFASLPDTVKAAVLSGEGQHFCAGLDLSELADHDVFGGILHSRMWHAAFDRIQFGRIPVVAALHGAVIGGGLELACVAHIRVAEPSTYYALPEGQRGIFVGGGASARVPKLIGFARMTDMMLTGRAYDADEGQAIGLSHYRVGEGEAVGKAIELARRIATNAPLSNFAVLQALPRIAQMPQAEGLFVESLMAAIAQGDEAAKARMKDFLAGRAGKVTRQ